MDELLNQASLTDLPPNFRERFIRELETQVNRAVGDDRDGCPAGK